jgi:hypothetical protein
MSILIHFSGFRWRKILDICKCKYLCFCFSKSRLLLLPLTTIRPRQWMNWLIIHIYLNSYLNYKIKGRILIRLVVYLLSERIRDLVRLFSIKINSPLIHLSLLDLFPVVFHTLGRELITLIHFIWVPRYAFFFISGVNMNWLTLLLSIELNFRICHLVPVITRVVGAIHHANPALDLDQHLTLRDLPIQPVIHLLLRLNQSLPVLQPIHRRSLQ